MNWENINFAPEEIKVQALHNPPNTQMEEETNENEMIQLKKFQDPTKNIERQTHIALLTEFGNLLMAHNIAGLIDSVLTKDCQFFLLSSTGRTPLQYCLHPRDIHKIYKGVQIQERRVRESYIDLEKGTACQMCNFKVLYDGEDDAVDEIVAEIFTIKENKISKYKAFASKMTVAHEASDPFEITNKDRVLAIVKQINYALAGKPDFEKVPEYFHKNVKYKIWSWDSQKCFELEKHNFAESFHNMQENFKIKSIVPYEVLTEGKIAVGTYVYHLECITGNYANKKYIWLTTCYYRFEEDSNKIIKVSQQGELHLEGDVEIPFSVFSREKLIQKAEKIYLGAPTVELFYSDVFALGVIAHVFGPEGASYIGLNKGTAVVDKIVENNMRNQRNLRKKIKLVESLIDCCDSSYDIVILIHRIFWDIDYFQEGDDDTKKFDTIVVTRYKLEHGKITKGLGLITPLQGSTPPHFEDS